MGRIPKGRILVSMDEAKTTTEGIILPSGLVKSNIGMVVQSGISLVPVGSRVALDEEQIMEIEVEGQKYVSVREGAILMITK